MKDQLSHLHWEVCVFVRSLEGVKIPLHASTPVGKQGSICESSKFYMYGIKEENIRVQTDGPHIGIQISNARIHIARMAWEVREEYAPNISTAGYSDVDVLQSELTCKILLESSQETSKRIPDLRLESVEVELKNWDAAIKHTTDPIYNKYSGLSNGQIKEAIEIAFTHHVITLFSEKVTPQREVGPIGNDITSVIVPNPPKVRV
eukprot:Phypoly_transcript_13622.p1 GENE.Phypoly_transcript_13622~~Phypoly_transcript_13622.p1  ORF type:complete len:233 (+),score=26.52 Phypoly_transcript_13622:87-701(+)